jgi:hypothetical protein
VGRKVERTAMKVRARFNYENNRWAGGGDAQRWYEELESIGPENVRARLAQTDAGSPGAIMIGAQTITIGFAQQWLAWHDQRRAERETTFRKCQIFWSRWTALAATATALVAAIGWALTAWRKW